ncbi:hypothetical protein MKW92_023826, partial [Papaver armeniacum]
MQLPYLLVLSLGGSTKKKAELVIPVHGDTSKGHKAGEFTEFALTGANGIFTGFTTEFV